LILIIWLISNTIQVTLLKEGVSGGTLVPLRGRGFRGTVGSLSRFPDYYIDIIIFKS